MATYRNKFNKIYMTGLIFLPLMGIFSAFMINDFWMVVFSVSFFLFLLALILITYTTVIITDAIGIKIKRKAETSLAMSGECQWGSIKKVRTSKTRSGHTTSLGYIPAEEIPSNPNQSNEEKKLKCMWFDSNYHNYADLLKEIRQKAAHAEFDQTTKEMMEKLK